MTDLQTFLSQHPQLRPEASRCIERFRASTELEVRQTVLRVQEQKKSPYTGEDMGVRLSFEAGREVEDTVIAYCSKLFELVANEYVAAEVITGDLTALFEEMAGATLVEAQRLYRNATAGMWFEGAPSLEETRLHKELADPTPFREIADHIVPEPSSLRVMSVVLDRVEKLRADATTKAIVLRVERLRELKDQNQAVNTTPPRAESAADSPQTSVPNGSAANQRAVVDGFIAKLAEAGHKITRKNFWTVAGYKDRTEFERFQRGDTRTTQSATASFNRVLRMKPEDFIRALEKKITQ